VNITAVLIHFRFTPESRHCIAPQRMSAMCQKQTHAVQQSAAGMTSSRRLHLPLNRRQVMTAIPTYKLQIRVEAAYL
jgi:hypothetical protein